MLIRTKTKIKRLVRDELHLILDDEEGSFDIALKLMTNLEPKRLDRMVELAKEKRQLESNIEKFRTSVEGEPETKRDTEVGNYAE